MDINKKEQVKEINEFFVQIDEILNTTIINNVNG